MEKEIENNILGILLIKPEKMGDVFIGEVDLRKEYFTRILNRTLYQEIYSQYKKSKTIDPLLISDSKKEVSDLVFKYMQETVSGSNFKEQCAKLKEEYMKKEIKNILSNGIERINNNKIGYEESTELVYDKLLSFLINESREDSMMELSEAIDIELQEIKRFCNSKEEVMKTGLVGLDKILNINKGNLITIAARPGMGKTAFALELLNRISRKKDVTFFSLEMSRRELVNRLLSSISRIPYKKIQEAERNKTFEGLYNDKVQESKKECNKLKSRIVDLPLASLSDVVKLSRKAKARFKTDLIIIDYLQLITLNKSTGNRNTEVGYITSKLKSLARELEIPIIILSQLSRGVELRDNKRPILSDLRDSGSIEQDSDTVMFLYRDGYYYDDKAKNVMELIIKKQRSGELGTVNLDFNMDIQKIKDL